MLGRGHGQEGEAEMKKLAMLLMMLPLVTLADVADPPMPGINEPFPAAFMVTVSLIVGCLILVYRSCRSFVGRLVVLPILILCGLVVFLQIRLVFNVNCTACSGRGFVGGRDRLTCRCCKGSGQHVRWFSEKCQTLSEVEERIRVDDIRKRFDEAAHGDGNKRFRLHEYDGGIE